MRAESEALGAHGEALVSCNACTESKDGVLWGGGGDWRKAFTAELRSLRGISIQSAIPTADHRERSLERQDGDRVRYLLQPFLSYAFVCIYLEQRRHKSNKK